MATRLKELTRKLELLEDNLRRANRTAAAMRELLEETDQSYGPAQPIPTAPSPDALKVLANARLRKEQTQWQENALTSAY